MTKNRRLTGLLCAFIASMCWAGNYPVFRIVFNSAGAENLNELWAAWIRIFICVCTMLPFSFAVKSGGWEKIGENWKTEWKLFLFLGFALVGECVFALAAGKYTTAARTSLFANTAPVFTLVISFLFGKEALTGNKIIGGLLGLAGIVIAVFSRGGDAFTAGLSTLLGDMLALVSGFCWAVFTVFGGAASTKYHGIVCTVIYRVCGLIFMVPLLFFCSITLKLPWQTWLGLLYLGTLSGGVAVWLWAYAQKYVEPGVLGSFGYLGAFCATLFSMIFLNEKITPLFIAAFVLILGGMTLIIRQKRRMAN